MKIRTSYIIFVLAGLFFISNSGNPPNGRTGAPGDFGACNGCHNGGFPSIDGNIQISGIPGSVDAGQTYALTVTINNTTNNATKGGFQMVVLDENNNNVGQLANPGMFSSISTSGQRDYFEHAPAQNFSGGSISYSVDWTAPSGGSAVDGESLTFYAAGVIANGNSSTSGDYGPTTTFETTFIAPVGAPEVSITNAIDPLCSGDDNGSATVSISGGTPPYSTSWSSGETSLTAIMLTSGLNSVTVTDNAGMSNEATIELNDPEPVEVNSSIGLVSCFNGSDGSIELSVSGGSGSYSFLWSNDETISKITDLSAGTYDVTVSDTNDCTYEDSFSLSNPIEIINTLQSITDVDCSGDETGAIFINTSGGTGNVSFLWSDESTEQNLLNVSAGDYTLISSDENGCTQEDSYTIEGPGTSLEVIIEEVVSIPCNNLFGSLEAIANENTVTYLWSDGTSDQENTDVLAGVYSVTVTNEFGCDATTTYTLMEPDSLGLVFNILQQPSIGFPIGGEISATASGGTSPYTYLWSTLDTTAIIDSLSAGTYFLNITDSNGCSVLDSVVVEQIPCELEASVLFTPIQCFSDSTIVTVTPEGGAGIVNFEWSSGTNLDLEYFPAGLYNVIASDEIGCRDTVDFEIIEPLLLELDFFTIDTVTCKDTLASIFTEYKGGAHPYQFSWSNGANKQNIEGIEGGSYVLIVTDANLCETVDTFIVVEDFSAEIVFQIDTVQVFLNESGMFNAIPKVNDYVQQLTGSCTDSLYLLYDSLFLSCEDLGLIEFEVELYNFQELLESRVVSALVLDTIAPTLLGFPITVDLNASGIAICEAQNISGTWVFPLEFISDNCQADYVNDKLEYSINIGDIPGEYSIDYEVSVVDQSGNESVGTVTYTYVLEEQPKISYELSDVSCFEGSDGCIDLTVEGGVDTIEILPENLCDLTAGDYFFTVINGDGCTYEFEETISEPTEIVIVITESQGEVPGESDGFIKVDVEGGTPPYSYSWRENNLEVSSEKDLVNFPSSQYDLVVTDANGCERVLSTFIEVTSTQIDLEEILTVYPNPFDNKLVIKGTDPSYSFHLTNVMGQRLELPLIAENEGMIINTNTLVSGFYFLEITNGNSSLVKRIIKR